jgi:hypothetical protein
MQPHVNLGINFRKRFKYATPSDKKLVRKELDALMGAFNREEEAWLFIKNTVRQFTKFLRREK